MGRIVQAIGSVPLFTLGYVFIANEFTEYRSTALVKGFMLLFFFIGGILLCLSAIMFFLLPDTENKGEVLKIILNRSFIVEMINTLTGFIIVGLNEATLEPHIRQFGLAPTVVGLIFIVSGGMYSIGSLVRGKIYHKTKRSPRVLQQCQKLQKSFFHPLDVSLITLWLVIFAQVLLGIVAGGKIIMGFNYASRSTVSRGFLDDVTTLTILSGLFNSTFCFGYFIGPSLGEEMGYENGSMVLLGIELAAMVITVLRVLWKKLAKVVKEMQEL
ncbi:MFS-type transporter SLC18B1-like [Tachypleus tridentatus]|uniref:MFS-type transporter SLC18B1-like n=1 Tax=Tachypleus tridentatus TaxID=6853 RepID=UPI003FD0C231